MTDLMNNQAHSQDLVDQVSTICQQAGEAILEVYRGSEGIEVDYKADDSPLTKADLAAHKILVKGLSTLLEGVPVLSEESTLPPFEQRRQWSRYWLIDPLDGTKEFINRNGEFTVNVALIDGSRPTLGVVHVPVQGITYTGADGLGACKIANNKKESIAVRGIQQRLDKNQGIDVVASRRHGSDQLQIALEKLKDKFGSVETVSMGSSLKLCLVAEGKADIYPRLALTSEWDTAAAQAVVDAAGGKVVDADFELLTYNQKSDILNPHFYVLGDKNWDWKDILS